MTDLASGQLPYDEWVVRMRAVLTWHRLKDSPFDEAWRLAIKRYPIPEMWGLDPVENDGWHVGPEMEAWRFFRNHAKAAYHGLSVPKRCQAEDCMGYRPCPRHGDAGIDWPEIGADNDSLVRGHRIETPPDAVHCLMCGRKHSPGDENHGKPELEAAA